MNDSFLHLASVFLGGRLILAAAAYALGRRPAPLAWLEHLLIAAMLIALALALGGWGPELPLKQLHIYPLVSLGCLFIAGAIVAVTYVRRFLNA